MKTILVVDDEEVILSVISKYLFNQQIGLSVLRAGNGAEAIDQLESNQVDLVLTDLNMPVMDGFALLAYLSDNYPEIKKIAMTGLQSDDAEEKLRVLGINHCIAKPFNLSNMIEEIHHLLGSDAVIPAAA